jgi:hypothetical protein
MCVARSRSSDFWAALSLSAGCWLARRSHQEADGSSLVCADGNERVRIAGVLNTELLMRAYGYVAGDFTVDYSYFEDVPLAEQPTAPAVYWATADNNARQQHVVGVYEASLTDGGFVVRRGNTISFTVFTPTSPRTVNCALSGDVDGVTSPYPTSAVAFTVVQTGAISSVTANMSASAPVGSYTIACSIAAGNVTYDASKPITVLFNPFASADATYMEAATDRAEFVESTSGVLFQGLSDNFEGHVWCVRVRMCEGV